jgi:hypothetical protein
MADANILLENSDLPGARQAGQLNTKLPLSLQGTAANLSVGGNLAVTGTSAFTGQVTLPSGSMISSNSRLNAPVFTNALTAINATATATAAQVATGYITSTSAAAVTITLPTAALLATQLAAHQGIIFDLYIDNTGGANTVTVALGAGMTMSDVAAVATYGVPTFGLLTFSATAAGAGRLTFIFTGGSACTVTRTA